MGFAALYPSYELLVNARIVGVERLMVHESDPAKIIKGLLKLMVHGAKKGL